MNSCGRTGLRAGLAMLAMVSLAAQAAGPCGTVEILRLQMDKEDIYSVSMLGIDGKAPFRTSYLHELAPGPHVLEVGERIPPQDLSYQVARSRDRGIRKKKLELTVEPNKLYLVGAQFDRENSAKVKEYWKPVVVSVTDKPCTPQ